MNPSSKPEFDLMCTCAQILFSLQENCSKFHHQKAMDFVPCCATPCRAKSFSGGTARHNWNTTKPSQALTRQLSRRESFYLRKTLDAKKLPQKGELVSHSGD